MLKKRPNRDLIEKLKRFSSLFDRVFVLISGSFWIFSTLLDIYNLERYWLDYTVELYGCFFLFYMMLFSINPKLVPIKIYNSFNLITTVSGRGTLLIIISSLFLKDNNTFHQFCAVLLFIGGILYLLWEFLVPTTREELAKIEGIYINNNINKNNSIETKVSDNIKFDNNNIISVFDRNSIISNTQNESKLYKEQINEINKENLSNINFEAENKKEKNEVDFKNENDEKIDNNQNILIVENIQKTDNPYEIPEDF
jgi:hypothetical protein